MTNELKARLKDKQLKLEISDEAVDYIVENGYDSIYGARPLKRYIQQRLETMLAKSILSGDFSAGDTIYVGVNDGGMYATKK
jgi:ATP-dependent Clp protease ATP-binding subunit ClpB